MREPLQHVLVRFDNEETGALFWVSNNRWSPEYPDAAYFTDEDEAIATQVRLRKRYGVSCAVIRDYGLLSEETIAPDDTNENDHGDFITELSSQGSKTERA